MIYISSFTFSIIIDILFYNDKTMHKLIEDNGKFNLKYHLPRNIFSDIANYIFSCLLEWLIDYQDKLIDLKKNLGVIDIENIDNIESNNSRNETKTYSNIKLNVRENKCISSIRSLNDTVKLNNKKLKHHNKNDFAIKKSVNQITNNNNNDNQIKNINDNNRNNEKKGEKEEISKSIEKSFRRNRIKFYIFILIFQLFSWYFISCFCALYKNTQKHLGTDILIGRGIDFISSLLISFYILIIRIFIIRSSFCNCFIKKFSNKCLKNNKLKSISNYIKEIVIIYAFQKTIEILIAVYIKYI